MAVLAAKDGGGAEGGALSCEQRRGAGLLPEGGGSAGMRGAVENRGIGEGLPGGACQSLFPEPPQLFNRRDSLDARAGRRRGALGRILCGRGRGNGAILADLFARDAHRTPPNTCAGLALTHCIGASVVGGLWIHADQGGWTNARSRDAATVQGVVVVIPWFEARLAAHSDCADEQHEGCQGTPRARHVATCPDASDATAPRNCGLRAFERVCPQREKKNGELPMGTYP